VIYRLTMTWESERRPEEWAGRVPTRKEWGRLLMYLLGLYAEIQQAGVAITQEAGSDPT
jgi:hypothetical protein